MNTWQLSPRPQAVTELYFTHYQQLPTQLDAEAKQDVTFTIHNLEHRTTTYHYKLVAMSTDVRTERLLATGVVTLEHDKTRVTSRTVVVPTLATRIAIKVSLEYEGLAFGSDTPSLQTQSIHYWATVNNPSAQSKDNHEVS
jgi:hypothetical protein